MSKLRLLKAAFLVGCVLDSSGLFAREAIIIDFANGADGRTSRGLTPADSNRGIGVIAQQVATVVPEAVQANEDGLLSVAYGNLVGVLIEAVKELSRKIDRLDRA